MNYFCFVPFFKNYHRRENFLSLLWKFFVTGLKKLFHRLENSFLFVCFLCSVCRILCVSVDISLNIRGYFITYPWIFHYVSTVTRVFCFVLAVYWLYVLGFSHIGGFVFTHTNLTEIFFHRWIFLSRESRESREVFFHRWFWSHTDLTKRVRRPKGPKAISQMARRFARACRPRRVFAHRMVHASETMRASWDLWDLCEINS